MKDSQLVKMKLRCLESLLRKKFSDDLEIIKYSTESLLPIGENYGSTILKVHATVKRNAEAKEEDLHLVAKMLPATEIQRKVFDSTYTFKKETFLYEELIPSYQSLEREYAATEAGVFDIVPEFYGARYSLKSDGQVDDDVVILMQNLKALGYYTGDRREGLDLEHAKVALIALSRFHALGIAMRQHDPANFELLKARAKCSNIEVDKIDELLAFLVQAMDRDPEISSQRDRYAASMTHQGYVNMWRAQPPEAWSTITHSDFWVNNIMFRKDSPSGRVTDIKFVDFQNYLNLSPLQELTFFLMVSLDARVMDNHFDYMIDTYYHNFLAELKRMRCDVEAFARDKFDERLKIDAFNEFPRCPFMIRILTADVRTDISIDQVDDLLLDQTVSPLFYEKLQKCVKKYVEKGWFRDSR